MEHDEAQQIDLAVGARIKEIRLLRGVTRPALAGPAGVTPGQLAKYETGANRVSAGRLAVLARLLDVGVVEFYGAAGEARDPAQARADARLITDYNALSPADRAHVSALMRSLGQGRTAAD